MKQCSKCKEIKEETLFGKHKKFKDGLNCQCKECRKKYYLEHSKEILEYKRVYNLKNPQVRKKYRLENTEKIKDYNKKYTLKHLEDRKKYRLGHVKDRSEYNRKYYSEHSVEMSEYQKKYRQSNAGRVNIVRGRHTRRANSKSVVNDLTVDDVFFLEIFQENRCASCGRDISNKNYHIDHIYPLSKGGGLTLINVQLLCPHCNVVKFTETIDYIGYYLLTGEYLDRY